MTSIAETNPNKLQQERSRVAVLLADNARLDAHLKLGEDLRKDGWLYDHWQDSTTWESQTYFHLYMFMLWLRSDKEPPGFWKRLLEEGQLIIAREQFAKYHPSKEIKCP